jgi:hypothetical protein
MKKYDQYVASVDTYRHDFMRGMTQFINEHVINDYNVFIMTFLFRSLPSSEHVSKRIMEQEVERVFGRFLTEVVRNPWSERNRYRRPIFIGCPDWPVYKRHKNSSDVVGTGIHFAGVLLVPKHSRLKTGVRRHFRKCKEAYIRPGHLLQRIHIERAKEDFERVVSYSFKSIAKRRCHFDDLLVAPLSHAER